VKAVKSVVGKIKIRKGDKVKVIAGRDIGREGTVEKVLRRGGCLTVPGVNMLKKFVKKGREGEPTGIISVAGPIHISNVMLICPRCKKPARVGFGAVSGGKQLRVCRRCGKEIDSRK